MDFSTGPWTWILPALALTGLLMWFVVALLTRGLEFYRAELEVERSNHRDEVLIAEVRRLHARLDREGQPPTEVPRARVAR